MRNAIQQKGSLNSPLGRLLAQVTYSTDKEAKNRYTAMPRAADSYSYAREHVMNCEFLDIKNGR